MSKLQEFCKKGLNNMTRLTLNEAIAHAREVAERNRKQYKNCPSDRTDIRHQTCEECAEEHKQIAEWLEELKRRREYDGEIIGSGVLKNAYNKAIDDLLEDANEMAIEVDTGTYTMNAIGIGLLEQIAEQLKEGGTDE